jgi:hypothetical protein
MYCMYYKHYIHYICYKHCMHSIHYIHTLYYICKLMLIICYIHCNVELAHVFPTLILPSLYIDTKMKLLSLSPSLFPGAAIMKV